MYTRNTNIRKTKTQETQNTETTTQRFLFQNSSLTKRLLLQCIALMVKIFEKCIKKALFWFISSCRTAPLLKNKLQHNNCFSTVAEQLVFITLSRG